MKYLYLFSFRFSKACAYLFQAGEYKFKNFWREFWRTDNFHKVPIGKHVPSSRYKLARWAVLSTQILLVLAALLRLLVGTSGWSCSFIALGLLLMSPVLAAITGIFISSFLIKGLPADPVITNKKSRKSRKPKRKR